MKKWMIIVLLLLASPCWGQVLTGVTISGVTVGGADVYGVRWDQSADTYQEGRVVDDVWVAATITNFPVQNTMQRVVLQDNGTVNYKLCPYNSALKEDCSTASVLDGTDGQVMVQFQQFHYLQAHDGNYRYFLVSFEPFSLTLSDSSVVDSAVHPAFYKGGSSTASLYRYISAYEANLYDDSGSAYVGGTSITEDCDNDVLASVNDILPIVNATRGCFRSMAESRGTGWHQLDANTYNAIALLFVTEYASLRSQAVLGDGITKYAAWPQGPQALAGNSNGIGNASGDTSATVSKWAATTAYSLNTEVIPNATQNTYTYRVTTAGTSDGSEPVWPTTLGGTVVDGTATWTCVRTDQYLSYRGIENLWGHIWKFVDGVNVHNSSANGSRLYTASDYTAYADDTDTGYSLVGSLAETDGYTTDILDATGFWPETVGGSSSTYLADYYYTYYGNDNDSGWRVALVGGYANDGSYAGAFYWYSYSSSSLAVSNVGGRLAF